jgi:hypothetical protein
MTSSCYLKFKKKISTGTVDRHHIDADQDSAFHFDPDPDIPQVPYMKNLHIFVSDYLLALSFVNILESIVKFSGICV